MSLSEEPIAKVQVEGDKPVYKSKKAFAFYFTLLLAVALVAFHAEATLINKLVDLCMTYLFGQSGVDIAQRYFQAKKEDDKS
jgi:hypothetical protein